MLGKIKLKLITVALVAIALTFLGQGTLAFYQSVGKATNVVTSGNIRFKIHEMTDAGTEFPEEGVYIVPGDIVSKKVSIESDCEHPFYLRLNVLFSKEFVLKACGVSSKKLSDHYLMWAELEIITEE